MARARLLSFPSFSAAHKGEGAPKAPQAKTMVYALAEKTPYLSPSDREKIAVMVALQDIYAFRDDETLVTFLRDTVHWSLKLPPNCAEEIALANGWALKVMLLLGGGEKYQDAEERVKGPPFQAAVRLGWDAFENASPESALHEKAKVTILGAVQLGAIVAPMAALSVAQEGLRRLRPLYDSGDHEKLAYLRDLALETALYPLQLVLKKEPKRYLSEIQRLLLHVAAAPAWERTLTGFWKNGLAEVKASLPAEAVRDLLFNAAEDPNLPLLFRAEASALYEKARPLKPLSHRPLPKARVIPLPR